MSEMPSSNSSDNVMLAVEGGRDICETIAALPPTSNSLPRRLQYIADVIEGAGKLPPAPVLVWWEADQTVRHAEIRTELVVGRQPTSQGPAFLNDKLLSRRHFAVRIVNGRCHVEDLGSRNGTAVNSPDNRIERRPLHDGDIIYAGDYIFVFLDNAKTC